MGFLRIAENVIRHGTALGLVSDKIGLTGKGGLIHDSSEDGVAILHEDVLELTESGVTIPWSEISSIESDDDSKLLHVDHCGGLRIEIPYGLCSFDGDSDEVSEKVNALIDETDSVSELMDAAREAEDEEDAVSKVSAAFDNIRESKRVYDLLQDGSEVIGFNEGLAVFGLYAFITELGSIEFDKVYDWVCNNAEDLRRISELLDFWLPIIDRKGYEEPRKIVAAIAASARYALEFGSGNLVWLRPSEGEEVDGYRRYALLHSFDDDNSLCREEGFLRWFDEEFCSPDSAKRRKVIVCTDEKRDLDHVGENIDGVVIVKPCDLENLIDYQGRKDPLDTIRGQQKAAPTDKGMTIPEAKAAAQRYAEARKARRLIFEEGHPRNGVTYVQHPMQPNTYMDLGSFHASMLERKYDELIGMLTELGAREITCSVENSGSTDSKLHERRSGHLEVGAKNIASVGGSASSENDSTKFTSLYKKLDTHLELRPVGDRRLPDGLIFYPFESSWQRLAKEVLSGRLMRASFDLTYRKDYAVTGKYVKSLSAKIESMIPGYAFDVGGSYESEFEEELKELESTTWHYEVDFGDQDEPKVDLKPADEKPAVSVAPQTATAGNEKAEAMILGRARRYARTEDAAKSGMLAEEQRRDLEKLASKYGVDEFRLEELIDEAFQ